MTTEVLEEIIGKTLKEVEQDRSEYPCSLTLFFEDGSRLNFGHVQDCCEVVVIEDVNGDWEDLIGEPLLVAEERVKYGRSDYDHETWTFYTFRTVKGSVDVRWHGSSNGYYSESVDRWFTEGSS